MKNAPTQFIRICPECGIEVYHTSKSNLNKMNKLNSPCKSCRGKSQRKYQTKTLVRKCPSCKIQLDYGSIKLYNQAVDRNSCCKRCSKKVPCTEDKKRKISASNSGIKNGMFGKTHSEEYKKYLSEKLKNNPLPKTKNGIDKMRISMRKKYAEKFICYGYKYPRINPTACQFIEKYGIENGYSFQHGMNGGEVYFPEVGAFVDGYDKTRNVVFEYDEKHHFDSAGGLKEKDLNRMKDLIKNIGCKVIRYNESKKIIQEYN